MFLLKLFHVAVRRKGKLWNKAQPSPFTSQSRLEMFPRQTWEAANTKGTGAEQACTNMQTQATQCHLCGFGFRRWRNSEDKPNNLLSLIKAV